MTAEKMTAQLIYADKIREKFLNMTVDGEERLAVSIALKLNTMKINDWQ